jgi:hypothetical protein
MSPSQDFTDLDIASKEQTIAPYVRVHEPVAIGWSSTDFTFPDRGFTTSTVLEEPSESGTQNFVILFNQADALNPDNLSAIVYLHEGWSQISVQTATGALTKVSVQTSDPIVSGFLSSAGGLILRPTSIQNSVFKRISELMELAVEDEIEMSPSSFWDLWSFISAPSLVHAPNVFALDSGYFRAVWKNSEGERVALEFQGSQTVAFVIFEYDRSVDKMMRIAGTQALSRVQAQIRVACADHLLTR